MPDRTRYLMKMMFVTTCLAVGCTSSGSLGCGSSDEEPGAPKIDSNLVGIYTLDNYQQSEASCDALADAPVASRVVLYGVESESAPGGVALGGQFCGSALDCRRKVRELPFTTNYAFLQGNDANGWEGWGIASRDMVGDDCLVQVQTHALSSTGNKTIRIDTREVETRYDASEPAEGTDTVTCTIRGAIDAVTPDSPCKKVFLLEATFEEGL